MNISIIIPTYNEEQNIGRLLNYLLTHSSKGTEIIVVDGGSDDNTVSICEKYNIEIKKTEKSRAKQMNEGANSSSHDILYFVHADTIPPKSFEKDILEVVKVEKMAGSYRSQYDGGSWLLNINAFFTRFNWLVARGGDQSLFIQSELFNKLGGFDEAMVIMEEYPLIRKLLNQKRFKVLNRSVLISARKYNKRSWFKVSKANYIAYRMFKRGEPSREIKLKYLKLLQ